MCYPRRIFFKYVLSTKTNTLHKLLHKWKPKIEIQIKNLLTIDNFPLGAVLMKKSNLTWHIGKRIIATLGCDYITLVKICMNISNMLKSSTRDWNTLVTPSTGKNRTYLVASITVFVWQQLSMSSITEFLMSPNLLFKAIY